MSGVYNVIDWATRRYPASERGEREVINRGVSALRKIGQNNKNSYQSEPEQCVCI